MPLSYWFKIVDFIVCFQINIFMTVCTELSGNYVLGKGSTRNRLSEIKMPQ
jgi:hypothetical protein